MIDDRSNDVEDHDKEENNLTKLISDDHFVTLSAPPSFITPFPLPRLHIAVHHSTVFQEVQGLRGKKIHGIFWLED